jgi:uncharacterized glyoxalase superfamily protein PhnB
MLVHSLSACITTAKVAESRDFYVKHFGARVTFDCGWYVNLEFGEGASLQFMAPQSGGPACDSAGLMCNFRVADADAEFLSLTASGLAIVMPPKDHPWGDRGFAIQDPNGIVLYIYSEREPDAEFKP